MVEEVNSSLVKEVQTNLGKYVKKPPLNEKLLKKPPFRYLHDLITSIIHDTGFLRGLYSEDELNSNNVKDKNAKLDFLDKLIAAIKKVTGENVAARSGKIIAGLEVNKTLELLLIIGKAIDDKVDCSVIVVDDMKKESKRPQKSVVVKDKKTIKLNATKPKEKKSEINPKKISFPTKNTAKKALPPSVPVENFHISEEQDNGQGNGNEQITIISPALPEQIVSNEIINDRKTGSGNENITRKNSVEKRSTSSGRSSGQRKSSPVRKNSIRGSNAPANSIENTNKEDVSSASKTKKTPSSEGNDRNLEETPIENSSPNLEEGGKKSENNQVSENEEADKNLGNPKNKKKEHSSVPRPSSARPSSRRFSYSNSLQKDDVDSTAMKEVKLEKQPNANRPPSARPGAPRIRDRGEVLAAEEVKTPVGSINVIEEGKFDQFHDEKDNSFIVIENKKTEAAPIDHSSPINHQEQGKLVDQILKTQKELNDSIAVDASQNRLSGIEWEMGRQREREMAIKETDKIRNFIQILTSAANPLGKIFDFLQEDVDEMQRELQHWKKINETLHRQQFAEIEFGKTFLLPLQKQLEEVESSIQEEYRQITNVKHNILMNDEKILKLMSSTNKSRSK